jgi:hypothetical protein
MAERSQTLLKIPKEEARQQLRRRIERAKEILPAPIRSYEALTKAEEQEDSWRKFNIEYLSRVFTTTEYAYESEGCRV